jgi:hypothetical protein
MDWQKMKLNQQETGKLFRSESHARIDHEKSRNFFVGIRRLRPENPKVNQI